jgi:transposase
MESNEYELDNNAIERQMKYIAFGRKNYYFAGSHDGARRAAVLYSLLGTCRLEDGPNNST